ncbi:MAG: dTMP kinase [Candidatus Latescibacterota bacterium]|nr:MAG: dTMP kinase [Candidatus Latescibacterota bacterium]
MRKNRGLFIVLEGIDGSGTTTQAKKLHNYLSDQGFESVLTNEPTDEPVGKLIRDALSRRITSPKTSRRIDFSERALCLLFAADRIEHSGVIEEARSDGIHVVCDRYILSSIAYQSLDPGITPRRVIEINKGCSIPDITFLLRVPVNECLSRLKNRKDAPTIYEKKEFLEGIDRNYAKTLQLYRKSFGPLVAIDGTAPENKVHNEIIKHLRTRLPR